MTKIMDGVRVRTYEEWIKLPEVIELNESIEDCSTCDGEGSHICDCGHEHDCEACNGSGKETDLKELYNKALKVELQKLLSWSQSATA